MARINLLPWREAARKQRLKEFGLMALFSLLFTVLIFVYWHFHNEFLIDHQKKRNEFLKSRIAEVELQIREIKALEKTRKKLVDRMQVIQDLQTSGPLIVRLMDEIVITLPQGSYLESLKHNGTAVNLEGKAQSNARVSAYMRNIESSDWLAKPELKTIQKTAKGGGSKDSKKRDPSFKLSFQQVIPRQDENSEAR